MTTITLPIKCSTVKKIYALLQPCIDMLPHVIVWSLVATMYLIAVIGFMNPLLIPSEAGSLWHDCPFYSGLFFLGASICATGIVLLLYGVSVTCIKDD